MKIKINIFTGLRCLAQTLGMMLLLLTVVSCSRESSSTADGPGKDSSGDAATVAVTKVAREDLSKSVDLTAEFLPWQNVEIHAKVSGYVKEINVDIGDHAKTGDVLATLEIPEIEDELKQAAAAISTAQEEVKSMQADYDDTTLIANRMSAAAKETQGLIAQQDIDTANQKNRASEANLAAAKQKVEEAQANADRLRDMVAYSKIIAPFDGVVTKRYADTGALVQAGTVQSGTSANSNSMPLISFAELKVLRLQFPVPEADVAFVHVGDSVEVDVLSLGKQFEGKVARFAQNVDKSTRTMLTEIDVDNSNYTYTPGMYATVRLNLAQQKNVLTVPIQSVITGDKSSVWIVLDNKIIKKDVTVGLETPDKAEILEGLQEGDLVVVGSRSSLQVGQSVVPQLVENRNP
jgi:RND family efflux transporter MFP subunit